MLKPNLVEVIRSMYGLNMLGDASRGPAGSAIRRSRYVRSRRQRRQKVGVSSTSTLYTSSRPVSMAKLSHHFTASG